MTSYWPLLLVPIAILGTLGALYRLGVPLPGWLDTVGEYAWYAAAFLLGVLTLGVLRGERKDTTAGDVASDKLEDIDQQTKEDYENGPTTPDPDVADAADEQLHDTADDIDTELGDGFQPEDDDIDWPDDLRPVD